MKADPQAASVFSLFTFVLGLCYIIIPVIEHEHKCEDILRKIGITIGGFCLLFSFLMAIISYRSYREYSIHTYVIIYGLASLVMVGIGIWGWVELLKDSGIACRYEKRSGIWLALMILNMVSTAVLGTTGSQVFTQ